MSYLTYAEILLKVTEPLDLQDEVFISDSEMMGYCNDAIKKCEAKIHTIYEDYFITDAPLALVSGQSEINLPSDIYAAKIRSIIFTQGIGSTEVYEIHRMKDINKFLRIEESKANDVNTSYYRYWLKNGSPAQDGRKIKLVPAARETAANKVIMYYLRKANQVTTETDLVDIPEFYSVIVAYMRYMAYRKEGNPSSEDAAAEYTAAEKDMIDTLTDMVPDGENEIPIPEDIYNGGVEP